MSELPLLANVLEQVRFAFAHTLSPDRVRTMGLVRLFSRVTNVKFAGLLVLTWLPVPWTFIRVVLSAQEQTIRSNVVSTLNAIVSTSTIL